MYSPHACSAGCRLLSRGSNTCGGYIESAGSGSGSGDVSAPAGSGSGSGDVSGPAGSGSSDMFSINGTFRDR